MKTTVASLVAALLLTLGLAPSASASGPTGSALISATCQYWFGTTQVRLVAPYDVMSWRCVVRTTNGQTWLRGMDINSVCRVYNWGRSTYGNFNDPYSWRCTK